MTNKYLEEALKSFPSWMDIRKRVNKSSGGLYLKSIVAETEDMENAIEELRKSFFSYNYLDKEDRTPYEVYRYLVGEGDVEVKGHAVTDDEILFSNNEQLLLRVDEWVVSKNNLGVIEYTNDSGTFEVEGNLHHLWNIFDEFALYSGLERQVGESNKNLMARIYNGYRRKTNSTEKGIKHAIMNVLEGKANVNPEDISIERVDESNLFLEDSSGSKVIDTLAEIDKDVIRHKEWGKTRWDHDFKELDYVSHKWDREIEVKKSGTGQLNDLKVTTLEEEGLVGRTNIDIHLYQRSRTVIEEWIKKNKKEIKVPMSLTKYSDELKPQNINFKVEAEEAVQIDPSQVAIDTYAIEEGDFEINIEDIAIERMDDTYEIIEGGIIEESQEIQLEVLPKEKYADMSIKSMHITYENGEKESLLIDNTGFTETNGVTTPNEQKFYGKKVADFYSVKNMTNSSVGMSSIDSSEESELVIDVSDIENQYLRTRVNAGLTLGANNDGYITSENFNESGGTFYSEKDKGSIELKGKMNHVEIDIEKGNAIISIKSETLNDTIISNGKKKHVFDFQVGEEVQVEIQKISSQNEMIVNQIRYSSIEVSFELTNGTMIQTPQGNIIPSSTGKNYLKVRLKSNLGHSVNVEQIFIGTSLEGKKYVSKKITTKKRGKLHIETGGDVNLINHTSSTVKSNYSTANTYRNNSDSPSFLEIDKGVVEEIKKSVPVVHSMYYKGNTGFFLEIPPGKTVEKVKFTGMLKRHTSSKRLSDVLVGYENHDVLSSKSTKALILREGDNEKKVRIDKEMVSEKGEFVVFSNLPEGMKLFFVIDSENNKEVSPIGSQGFESLYFYKESKVHSVAYYTEKLFSPVLRDVELNDNFYPEIEDNQLVIYFIAEGTDSAGSILFTDGKSWSTKLKNVDIEVKGLEVHENILSSEIEIESSFVLSNFMSLEEIIEDDQENEHRLSQYNISLSDGYDITYDTETSGTYEDIVNFSELNKLYHTNIESIHNIQEKDTGMKIDSSAYTLFNKEGIIQWHDKDLLGKEFLVQYDYKIPKGIIISDIDILYEIVGQSLETLKLLGIISLTEVSGDATLSQEEYGLVKESHKTVMTSSNPSIEAYMDGNTVRIKKNDQSENIIYANPGYYYSENKEWYMYANERIQEGGGDNSIEMEDVEQQNDELILSQSSENYIKDSRMESNMMQPLMDLEIDNERFVTGISKFQRLSACEMYNMLTVFESEIEIAERGYNGKGISIKSNREKNGYVAINISDYLDKGDRVSLYAEEDLDVYIGRKEKSFEGEKETIKDLVGMNKTDIFSYYDIDSTDRHYIIAKGEGIIDDILIYNKEDKDTARAHEKNINRLGIEVPPVTIKTDAILKIERDFSLLNQVEFNDNRIRTSSDIQWDITKVKNYMEGVGSYVKEGVYLEKDQYLISRDRVGVLYLPAAKLDHFDHVSTVHLKINELSQEGMTGFTVRVLSGSSEDTMESVGSFEGNTVDIPKSKLSSYVKFIVNVPVHTTIESIDLFATYIQSDKDISVIYHNKGEYVSKVYDAGFDKDWRIKSIEGEVNSNSKTSYLAVRGLRSDNRNTVATEWKRIDIDKNSDVLNNVYFESYRYFQVGAFLNRQEDVITLKSVRLEAMD